MEQMRTRQEIVQAHDLLVQFILHRDLAPEVDPLLWEEIASCAQVLCWVLQHEHSRVFARCLERVEQLGAFPVKKGEGS